ncbi:MAG: hypothetical protein H7A22_10570 [Spirochaetales bacterium]|nr:hypothetical protein [Spirochaetales bacterium]
MQNVSRKNKQRERNLKVRRALIGAGAVGVLALSVYCVLASRDGSVRAARDYLSGRTPIIFAHRGASAYHTENTLRAFDVALDMGADVLELDVRLSSDGKVVVTHDDTLERIGGRGDLVVSGTSFETLRSVELRPIAADDAESMTDLGTILERYRSSRVNIELKSEEVALVDSVLHLISEHRAQDRVLVVSANGELLQAFRERSAGSVPTGASFWEVTLFLASFWLSLAANPDFDALQIPASETIPGLVSADFIDYAHRHGVHVHYWTVNEPEMMRRLFELGADGIMTDYPDRAYRVRAELSL